MANSFYDDSIWTRLRNFMYNNRTWILGVLVFIFFICTISLAAKSNSCPESPTTPPTPPAPDCSADGGLRDCLPDNLPGAAKSAGECRKRGCCWDDSTSKCRFAANHRGYSISLTETNSNGLKARLKRNFPSGFEDDIPEVDLTISFLANEMLRIKFTDPVNERWEVKLPQDLELPTEAKLSNLLYSVNLNETGVLEVVRKSSGKVLLETSLSTLIYSNLFHQIEFKTASDKAFGFSEHKENNFVKNFTETTNYPIWNRGEQPSQGIRNLYGCHPFYLMPEGHDQKVHDSHGVFLFNSNAMDIVVANTPSVTWRVVGGVLDFFVFLGPTPLQVTQQYISLIGKPALQPYWSLGFHIARYGYNSSEEMKKVIERNRAIQIPYDVQWTDIDALEDYHNIFTYNTQNFSDLPDIVTDLHNNNMKYVPMADPSISDTDPNGKYQYELGLQHDIYVKQEDGTTDLKVKVWNKETSVWVDFTHPNATDFWHDLAVDLDKNTTLDGLWIDMNEPYNMWDQHETRCGANDISPQYVPGIENGLLSNHTACLNAKHHLSNHYNVHNLYGLYEAKTTYDTLVRMGKRPFVLSRATAMSSGRYTAHWNGDIDSSWDHLRWSITSLLEFNMYGIPMIGADICGFQKYNVSEHLCARWMELGSFYPFSRNHNDQLLAAEDTPKRDNDPGSWEKKDGKESPVVVGSRIALKLRYQLMPYFYTVMAENSRTGVPSVRSLWFNNPTDPDAFGVEDQFMWGDSIMVVPIVQEKEGKYDESEVSRDVYLPAGHWWDIQTKNWYQGPETKHVQIDLESIMVLIKDGSVIATQEPELTTTETRVKPFTLKIILDDDKVAKGSLYWDSGDSLEPLSNKTYSFINFSVESNKLTATKEKGTEFDEKMTLGKIMLINVADGLKTIKVNGEVNSGLKLDYDRGQPRILTVTGFDLDVNSKTSTDPLTIEWS